MKIKILMQNTVPDKIITAPHPSPTIHLKNHFTIHVNVKYKQELQKKNRTES